MIWGENPLFSETSKSFPFWHFGVPGNGTFFPTSSCCRIHFQEPNLLQVHVKDGALEVCLGATKNKGKTYQPSRFKMQVPCWFFNIHILLIWIPYLKQKNKTHQKAKTKGKPSIRPKNDETTPLNFNRNLQKFVHCQFSEAASVVNHRCFNCFSAWRPRQSLNPNSGMWEPTLERFRASVVLKSSMELDVGREAAGFPNQKKEGNGPFPYVLQRFISIFLEWRKKMLGF